MNTKKSSVDLGSAQKELIDAKNVFKRATTALHKAENHFNASKEKLDSAQQAFDRAVQSVRSR